MTRKSNFGKLIIIMSLVMGALSLSLMLISNEREKNNNQSITIDLSTMQLVQLEGPRDGDPIAVVDTTLGEVRFRLYPEYSPNAVANFVSLAESGYYDNTYVFDSKQGAYSSMGAPNPDGSVNGGFSQDQERVKRELHQNLWPFRGAVCLFSNTYEQTFKQKVLGGGTYYVGSRFTLLNSVKFDEEFSAEIRESSINKKLAEAFIKKGGIPNFSQQVTIIGQTYEGFDVVDKLASLETKNTGKYDAPAEEVKINSVKIEKYSSAKASSSAAE